jgi:FAD/FMN-containing dehydrogenase
MDRRQFCKTSFAASLAVGTPFLAGCGRRAETEASIPAVSLDGAAIELENAAIQELSESLSGPMILSGHPEYDRARTIWNGMHDKRPALIVRPANSTDVSHAVSFARDNNLDLSQMNGVAVDRDTQRAHAQGGALLGQLDAAALAQGMVTTAGVVSHTGVGGYTLGGGFGRLNRKYGLTVDNVRGAEIITADGEVRRISADQEADLFWAIRGGGGNFGVVTEFEYQLYPFDRNVLSGSIVWPIEMARDVLEYYAEAADGFSDEMYIGPVMARNPDLGDVIVMDVVYNGDPSVGEKELAALRAVATPVVDGVIVQDYMVMQTINDVAFGHGIRSYAKNGMVKEWSQGLVDALIDAYDPRVFLANHVAGGAVKRVGETDTAFPHRNAEIMLVFASGWQEAEMDDEFIAATRAYYNAIEPFMGGYYDNIDFDGAEAAGNYGPAYERLARIKGRYDPRNLFRLNSNIEPAV